MLLLFRDVGIEDKLMMFSNGKDLVDRVDELLTCIENEEHHSVI